MLSSKKYAALDSIISMRDEREYEKVKNRMKLAVKIADALKKQNMSQIIILLNDTLVDIESILDIQLFTIQSC